MTAEQGKSQCVQMILSGHRLGRDRRELRRRDQRHRALHEPRYRRHVSADVAVIIDGQPQYRRRRDDRRVPDLHPVGLGELDRRRAAVRSPGSTPRECSRSGPRAPARGPGPACYGRGGTRATITDAFAALGLVGLSDIGYSAVTIDRAARRARSSASWPRRSGARSRRPPRRSSASRYPACIPTSARWFRASGIDPREFSCLAFGGAGPMMACFLARELGMQRDRRADHARRAVARSAA